MATSIRRDRRREKQLVTKIGSQTLRTLQYQRQKEKKNYSFWQWVGNLFYQSQTEKNIRALKLKLKQYKVDKQPVLKYGKA